MPRPLSRAAIIEAQRVSSNEAFLVLLTFYLGDDNWNPERRNQSKTTNLRVVNNTEDVTSRGMLFIAMPFKITLPQDVDLLISSPVQVEIDNVDSAIWQNIRRLTSSPWVGIEVILASAPDNVILATPGMRLRSASASSTVISGALQPDSIWQTGYPEADFDPPQNPGLFS